MKKIKNLRIKQINCLLLHIVNPFRMLFGNDLDVKIRLVQKAFAGFDAFPHRQCNIIFLIKSPKTLATFD